jgi:hypothetical protein
MISWLIDSAIRSIVLALAAGFILSLCRVRDAGIRLVVWTVVLYGVLLLPFLGTVLPPVAFPVIAPVRVASVIRLHHNHRPAVSQIRIRLVPHQACPAELPTLRGQAITRVIVGADDSHKTSKDSDADGIRRARGAHYHGLAAATDHSPGHVARVG